MALSIVFLILSLVFIYLEILMPTTIMATGSGILFLTSILLLFLQKVDIFFIIIFSSLGILLVAFVIQCSLWKMRKFFPKLLYSIFNFHSRKVMDQQLIGHEAVAITNINPVGKIMVGDQLFLAMCKGNSIDKGNFVLIIGGEGMHLIVSPVILNEA